MVDVAMLIASKRDTTKTVTSVLEAASRSPYSCRVFVFATTPPDVVDPRVEFLRDGKLLGSVWSYNHLAKVTRDESEFVLTLADGMCLAPGGFEIVEDLIARRAGGNRLVTVGFECGQPQYLDENTGLHGRDHQYVRYQCFTRESLENDFDGHIYNPHFRYHCCDIWLGAWCALMGRPARESTNANTRVTYCNPHEYNSTHDSHDEDVLGRLCRGFHTNRSYTAEPLGV